VGTAALGCPLGAAQSDPKAGAKSGKRLSLNLSRYCHPERSRFSRGAKSLP